MAAVDPAHLDDKQQYNQSFQKINLVVFVDRFLVYKLEVIAIYHCLTESIIFITIFHVFVQLVCVSNLSTDLFLDLDKMFEITIVSHMKWNEFKNVLEQCFY